MTTIDTKQFPLLSQINAPTDLRQLNEAELVALAVEMREFLLPIHQYFWRTPRRGAWAQ